jgi:septal ring factor EnvC (AmiA/AmiB activator)
MLQMMQNKVTAEGKKEQELFDKFMCYCNTGVDDLKASISSADTKIPQVESALKSAAAEKAQLEQDTKAAQDTRRECKEAIATATALREKEAATYAKVSGDYKANIAAMGKALTAIENGASGFLQTSGASVLRKLSIEMELSNADRDQIVSFLSQGSGSGYAPASGQISGILKQMKETMEADLADATAEEQKSVGNYDSLVAAKEKEIDAATKAVEDKLTRVGDLGVEIATMKEDLDDTAKAMLEDKKFLAELEKSCATKEAEWDARCKIRTEELLALADTIKMLNDDDALELFKKTLPGSSLLQIQVTNKQARGMALSALNAPGHVDYRLDLISLALKGKKVSTDKVIKMIDDMVVLLKKEQGDDDDKKEMCEKQLDKAEDDLKVTETTISDLEKEIADTKESIATLTDEVAALKKGIEELDKMVEDATYNRKEENEDYQSLMANDAAAKELIGMAKNRMNKFYNPSMYKAPPKRELTEEERITLNMGGTLAPTAAPGGIAGTGVTVFISEHRGAPPPPPETFGAYSKKSEESNGVMAMMDAMVADLDKEMQEADVEEKDAQAEYEEMMKDSAEKRVTDSKSITEKEGTKADDEANLQKLGTERTTKMKEALATVTVIEDLHKDCDWLLQNFDTRKEARAGEVDALKKAKAVLSGADFS